MIDQRMENSRQGIRESDVFLVIGTTNYINSIENPEDEDHVLLLEQISYARSLGKSAVILLDQNLKKNDVEKIRTVLKDMEIIGEFIYDKNDPHTLEEAVKSISDLLSRDEI